MSLGPEDIYSNFRDGVGGEGLSQAAAAVNELVARYEARADAIKALTGRMESSWTGDAAGAAQRGAGPLAVEHAMAAPEMGTAQDLTNRQVESFSRAGNSVVEMPAKPTAPDPMAVFTDPGSFATYDTQRREYLQAAAQNFTVMDSYSQASSFNSAEMPGSYGTILDDSAAVALRPTEPGGGIGSVIGTDDPAGDTRGSDGTSDRRATGSDETASSQDLSASDGTGTGTASDPRGATGTTAQGWTSPTNTGGQTGGPSQSGLPGTSTGQPAGTGPIGLGGHGGRDTSSRSGSLNQPGSRGGSGGGPGARGGSGNAGGTGGEPSTRGGPGSGGPGGGGGSGGGARGIGQRIGAGTFGPTGMAGVGDGDERAGRGRASAGGPGGMGGGGRGKAAEDLEHQAPAFLVEHDSDDLFGTDEITAPPVIGG